MIPWNIKLLVSLISITYESKTNYSSVNPQLKVQILRLSEGNNMEFFHSEAETKNNIILDSLHLLCSSIVWYSHLKFTQCLILIFHPMVYLVLIADVCFHVHSRFAYLWPPTSHMIYIYIYDIIYHLVMTNIAMENHHF